MPALPDDGLCFEFGRGRVLRHGFDIGLVATGEAVYPAWQAAEVLAGQGIAATVVSMHTIKPLDHALLTAVATQCKAIVTVEEHSVNGGLGEACASHLMQKRLFLPMKIMGIPDEYTVTGSQAEILAHYEISRDGIAKEALNLLR